MKIKLYPKEYDPIVADGNNAKATIEEIKYQKRLEDRAEIIEVQVDFEGLPIVPNGRVFMRL
jgi:hypothetical protein